MTIETRIAKLGEARSQFSLRGLLVLMAAFAWYLWMLHAGMGPADLAVLAVLPFGVGFVAHLVYALMWRWRGTAIIVCFLLTAAVFAVPAISSQGILSGLLLAGDLLWEPARALLRATRSDLVPAALLLASVLVFTPAHAVRPNLLTAVITAMAFSLWMGTAVLIFASC